MSLPNRLTILRVLLTFFFVFFVFHPGVSFKIMAFVAFAAASLTDFYDGYYAKKHDLITDFGKLMDPIADKFLILAAFFAFMYMRYIDAWMFAVIFIREIGVTAIRLYAMRRGMVLAAEQAGKIKTVLQIIAVLVILLFMASVEAAVRSQSSQSFLSYGHDGIYGLMLLVVAATLFSGLSFLWNNRDRVHAG